MTRRDWLTAMAGVSPGLLQAARQLDRQPAQGPVAALPDDPTFWSIAELRHALASGRLTPIEVTAAYLRRIDQQNGALGAFVTVTRERAMDDTRRLMLRLAAGAPRGPLAGVPVAHKDLFATRGIRTTGGSKLHDTWVPDDDADVVSRLAAAGTVLLGKTNTHELGGGVTTINPFFGTTHNPRDLSRIAGGSSGGSAAAVAARLALVATGSDTGGSARIPAALCGCVGFKPSFGLVRTTGLLGACPTFDHAAVLARTAEDALEVLAAIVGGTPPTTARGATASSSAAPPDAALSASALRTAYRAARSRGLRGLRVGVPRAYFFDALDNDVARQVDRVLTRLRADGAVVRDVFVPVPLAFYDTMFAPIAVSEIRATYAQAWRTRPEAFSQDFAAVFAGLGPTVRAVTAAREARAAFQRSLEGVLAELDVLVLPTVPQVAPRIAGPIDGMRILRNTWPFNAARVPAVSVPCGDGADGLPVGLQLVSAMFDDARLLAVAAAVQQM